MVEWVVEMSSADIAPGSKPNRVVVVTGAASGIGAATADWLAARGWEVVALDVSFDGPLTRSRREGVWLAYCDVRSEASVVRCFDDISKQFNCVDALVCCAGVLAVGSVIGTAIEDFDKLFEVNTRGAWLCARSAVGLMMRHRGGTVDGRIVFVGSISAMRPKVGNGVYGSQKAALHGLAAVMAAELGPVGIRVNVVAPGTVDTPMIRAVSSGAQAGRYRPSGLSPLGRIAKGEDVAAVVEFLLGSAAAYVSGVVLPVDGGTRAAFTSVS